MPRSTGGIQDKIILAEAVTYASTRSCVLSGRAGPVSLPRARDRELAHFAISRFLKLWGVRASIHLRPLARGPEDLSGAQDQACTGETPTQG
jgi:hypothetical protein